MRTFLMLPLSLNHYKFSDNFNWNIVLSADPF